MPFQGSTVISAGQVQSSPQITHNIHAMRIWRVHWQTDPIIDTWYNAGYTYTETDRVIGQWVLDPGVVGF